MAIRTITIEVQNTKNDQTNMSLDNRVKEALAEFNTATRELDFYRKGPFGSVKITIKESPDGE
jgi:hypothetical protein